MRRFVENTFLLLQVWTTLTQAVFNRRIIYDWWNQVGARFLFASRDAFIESRLTRSTSLRAIIWVLPWAIDLIISDIFDQCWRVKLIHVSQQIHIELSKQLSGVFRSRYFTIFDFQSTVHLVIKSNRSTMMLHCYFVGILLLGYLAQLSDAQSKLRHVKVICLYLDKKWNGHLLIIYRMFQDN